MQSYSLTGTITNQNNLPIQGVSVIAHDQDPNTPETQLGEAVFTNAQGQYTIAYKAEDFIIESRESGGADIVIRVYDGQGVLLGESDRYEDAPQHSTIDLQIDYELPVVSEEPTVAAPSISIKGNVQDRLQRSLKEATVQLWEDGANSYTLEAAPTDSSGAFELLLEGDIHDIAMDCTLFYFKVIYQNKVVANTQEQEPPIVWDISHNAEDRIEIKTNITGQVIEILFPKEKAIQLRQYTHLTIADIKAGRQDVLEELQEMVFTDITQQLQTALGDDVDPVITDAIETLGFSTCASKQLPIQDFVNTHLRKKKITQQQFDSVQKKLENAYLPKTMDEVLPDDKTLKEIPLFQQILEEGQAHILGKLANLPAKKCDALLHKGWRVQDTDFRVLDALKEDGVLNAKEHTALQHVMELNGLFDEQLSLIQVVLTKPIPGTSKKLQQLQDLVPLRVSDWEKTIKKAKTTPPNQLTTVAYAKVIEKRIEKAFPSAVLLDRFEPTKTEVLQQDFLELETVLKQSPNLLKTKDWDSLDLSGKTKTEVKTLKKAYDNSLKQLNKYHGLDVHRMSDPDGNLENHLINVSRKIQLLDTFYKNNAEKEILSFNLHPEADLEAQDINFTGIEPEDQTLLLRHIKTDQRLYGLTKDITQAQLLKENGFYTGMQMQAVSLPTLARIVGSDKEILRYSYENVLRNQLKTEEWFAKYYGLQDVFKAVPLGGVGFPALNENGENVNFENEVLRKYDGYQDYFGSLDYCDCQHCNSIFSPAAYFVDLMAWVEKMVLNDTFTEDLSNHPLHLQNRRPDLWYLDLSCSNTHDTIPYLDIINEVLENYIFYSQKSKDESVTEFYQKTPFQLIQETENDRAIFSKELYKTIYEALEEEKEEIYSIKAPFCLPLEEITVYLQHFPITLEEIALALDTQDQDTIARARLSISQKTYQLLGKTNDFEAINTASSLSLLFDTDLKNTSGHYEPMEVKEVLKALHISRQELTTALQTHFIRSSGHLLYTKSAKRKKDEDLQNNVEKLYGAFVIGDSTETETIPALDRLHRFIRLWKHTSWTMQELDIVLHQVNTKVNTTEEHSRNRIDTENLIRITKVQAIQTKFNQPLDHICILFQQFPEKTDKNNFFQQLFEQQFNQLPFSDSSKYPLGEQNFIHPIFENSDAESAEELPRILAGLGISDEQLFYLIKEGSPLFKALEKGNSFKLSLSNLSLLYRHARLAEYLGLTIPELFQLIRLQGEIIGGFIGNGKLEDLEKVIAYYDWWKTTPYSLDDVAYMKGNYPIETTYPTPDELTSDLFAAIEKDNPLVFTDTVFAYLDGVTEEQSKQIILGNFEHKINSEIKGSFSISFPPKIEEEKDKIAIQDFIKEEIHGNTYITPSYFYDKSNEPDSVLPEITKSVSSELFFLNYDLFEIIIQEKEDLIKKANQKAYKIKADADVSSFPDLESFKNPGAPAITESLLEKMEFDEIQIQEIISTKLEELPSENQYTLSPNFTDGEALRVPAHIPISQKEVNESIAKYRADHILCFYAGQLLNSSLEKVKILSELTGENLMDSIFTEEALALDNNATSIKHWLIKIQKLSILFKAKEYEEEALTELKGVLESKVSLEQQDENGTTKITIPQQVIQRINSITPFIQKDKLTALVNILESKITNQMFEVGTYDDLSDLLNAELTPIKLVNNKGGLGTESIQALVKLSKRIQLSQYLDVGGDVLSHLISPDYDDLVIAKNALLSAFRLKYQNEQEWEEKIAPFQDKIRGIKRDALSDYLINGLERITIDEKPVKRFQNSRELYKHFLIDTELEGCARTSRVVAAISSVQVFVQRILLNLEVSEDFELKIEPKDEYTQEQFTGQWEWRKNYRVWEANRKVFLYPENYIEPELRDNKTELFKELEEELLQREVNLEIVEEAYKKYMEGFEEVNSLQVAGAYHEKEIERYKNRVSGSVPIINPEASKDTIHLFAVTPGDENQLYYRKIENTYLSGLDGVKINWDSWEKVNLKVPVKKVSPIIYNGRLYVFWNEIKTKPNNQMLNGSSFFSGYSHTVNTKFSFMNIGKVWSNQSTINNKISIRDKTFDENNILSIVDDIIIENTSYREYYKNNDIDFTEAAYDIFDLMLSRPSRLYSAIEENSQIYLHINKHKIKNWGGISKSYLRKFFVPELDRDKNFHIEPEDNYTLKGWQWEKPFIKVNENIFIGIGDYIVKDLLNLSNNTLEEKKYLELEKYTFVWRYDGKAASLFEGFDLEVNKLRHLHSEIPNPQKMKQIVYIPISKKIELIYEKDGSTLNCMAESENTNLLVCYNYDKGYEIHKMNTDYINEITKKVSSNKISSFFQISFQKSFQEKSFPFQNYLTFENGIQNIYKTLYSSFNSKFSQKIYFWELFFHIPFLIANHLNSQQKFAEAQQWYHYIFNPNAKPDIEKPDAKNYIWQFRAFHDHTIANMRDALNDPASIRTYENDPFNPHAIARNRISAYQKSVVMKYIDNLLDWGDQLFAQDTMESINEATMLYILAYEILGEKPIAIGDCGEKKEKKAYEQIKKYITTEDGTTPVFIEELETSFGWTSPLSLIKTDPNTPRLIKLSFNAEDLKLPTVKDELEASLNQKNKGISMDSLVFTTLSKPVFCIPKNKDLLAYWDRVDDRLFKIRNCMNIKGIKRDLALFAPEIDPRLLVRATAEGVSIQDVLESLSGNLPPYRFPYLMAKAKEYVGLVQGFGGALQGALERKDIEQLSQLQATHQKNISNMSRYIRDRELEAAESSLEVLRRNQQAIVRKKEYYDQLTSGGLSSGERAQISYKNTADGLYMTSLAMSTIAGILGMAPNIVGMSNEVVPAFKVLSVYSSYFKYFAELNNLKSSAAATNANFARRQDGWKFQLNATNDELNVIEEQIKGADIRKAIAERNYEIFEQSIEQQDEVFDFIKDKFSNLGLYTWLSGQLMRLYRDAWNSAHTMAKMAERAYHFERSDDTSPLLNGGYWDASHHGLLAGQKLLIDLQNLERRYIETHHRKLEVDQSFSMMQIAPEALLKLKQEGECNFSIPELYFDLSYPGQYKRRMRSARLTIPCIVGPYVNVGATLTLTGSSIRLEPNPESSRKEMPPTRTTTIATSTAQNDSGVFEFSFRDERYMPFEGAGAISDWHIKLPKTFRPFDYNTINDVILHISYEADYDGVLAEKVEKDNAAIQNSIKHILHNEGLPRLFSLRQEFSDSYHKLLYKEGGTTSIEIRKKHFPIFVQGYDLVLAQLKIMVITDLTEVADSINEKIYLDDKEIKLTKDSPTLKSKVVLSGILDTLPSLLGTHTISLEKSDINSNLNKEHIKDVLIYFEYKIPSNEN